MYFKGFFHSDGIMYIVEINGGYVNIWKPERQSWPDYGKLEPVYWRSPTMTEWHDEQHQKVIKKVEELEHVLKACRWFQ